MSTSFEQNTHIALAVIFSVFSLLPLLLRFYAKQLTNQKALGGEDYLIIIAQILLFGLSAILIVGTVKGNLGGHTAVDASAKQIVTDEQRIFHTCEWAFQSVEKPTLGCIKLSLVVWYRKIFLGKKFNIASRIVGALVVAWAVGFFFPTVFACRPISVIYAGTIEQLFSECIDTITLLETFAITDVITDIMVLSLPIPMVWQLQMSTRRKSIISGIFMLGTLAVIASVAKLAVYIIIVRIARDPSKNIDQASYVGPTMYTSIIEASLGITAASLPMLRPVFSRKEVYSASSIYSRSRRSGTSQAHTGAALRCSSSKEQLKGSSLGAVQNEVGPWMLGNSHGDGVHDPVTIPSVNTYVSSNGLEAQDGVEIPMHCLEVRKDMHSQSYSTGLVP